MSRERNSERDAGTMPHGKDKRDQNRIDANKPRDPARVEKELAAMMGLEDDDED